jgi:hypothetical protein
MKEECIEKWLRSIGLCFGNLAKFHPKAELRSVVPIGRIDAQPYTKQVEQGRVNGNQIALLYFYIPLVI